MKKIVMRLQAMTIGAPALAQGQAQPAPPAPGGAREMVLTSAGTQESHKGAAQNFTGNVQAVPLFPARTPAANSGAFVTFEPSARSAWHTHSAGPVLVVTAGVGRVQQWGGPVEEIRPDDVIWTPPGVNHRHGAAPATAVTHMAISNEVGGENVEWMEKVSDEQ